MNIKSETTRLDYVRNNQTIIGAELYQGLMDSISIGETKAKNVGRCIILPTFFIGGLRDMHRRYLDSMALLHKFGKPDIFLTVTYNPNWPEIKAEISATEEPQNRADCYQEYFVRN